MAATFNLTSEAYSTYSIFALIFALGTAHGMNTATSLYCREDAINLIPELKKEKEAASLAYSSSAVKDVEILFDIISRKYCCITAEGNILSDNLQIQLAPLSRKGSLLPEMITLRSQPSETLKLELNDNEYLMHVYTTDNDLMYTLMVTINFEEGCPISFQLRLHPGYKIGGMCAVASIAGSSGKVVEITESNNLKGEYRLEYLELRVYEWHEKVQSLTKQPFDVMKRIENREHKYIISKSEGIPDLNLAARFCLLGDNDLLRELFQIGPYQDGHTLQITGERPPFPKHTICVNVFSEETLELKTIIFGVVVRSGYKFVFKVNTDDKFLKEKIVTVTTDDLKFSASEMMHIEEITDGYGAKPYEFPTVEIYEDTHEQKQILIDHNPPIKIFGTSPNIHCIIEGVDASEIDNYRSKTFLLKYGQRESLVKFGKFEPTFYNEERKGSLYLKEAF